jgi:hypothetical protein
MIWIELVGVEWGEEKPEMGEGWWRERERE